MEVYGTTVTLISGAILGIIVGFAAQRSGFCGRRAFADRFTGRSRAHGHAFLLAMCVALFLTQLLILTGYVDSTGIRQLAPTVPFLGVTIGGLLFGSGMMLAGGCPNRLLIRTGQGQGAALTLLLVLVVAVMATRDGVLAPVRLWFGQTRLDLPAVSLGQWLARDSGPAVALILSILLLGLWARAARASLRENPGLMIAALLIGVTVALSWYLSIAFADAFDLPEPHALSYIAPTQELLRFVAMSEMGFALEFGTALVVGTLGGSLISALSNGSFGKQSPSHRVSARTLSGALLMGFGGVLAQGCTFGHGLAGFSILSLTSLWALVMISLGAWVGQYWLSRTAASAGKGILSDSGTATSV